jgi:alpha-D-xyloside xylohydrolase
VLPLFVRAGSILPLGTAVESTNDAQKIAKLRVYPGADGDFDLYRDDGTTYAYETGDFEISHLHWSDSSAKLTHTGADIGFASPTGSIEIVNGDLRP